MIQVDVKQRQPAAGCLDFGEEEPFLTERGATERRVLMMADGKSRQDRVAIAEVKPPQPLVGDPVNRMREPGLLRKVSQMIEAPSPPRSLIDFLQGDHVDLQPRNEMG